MIRGAPSGAPLTQRTEKGSKVQIRDYVLRRLMVLPILVFGVSVIVFSLTRIGGSPIGTYLSHEMNAEEVAELEQKFHLDEPLPVQYVYWAGGVLTGDLGWSGVAAAPVTEVFPNKLAATMELAIASALVAVTLGIGLGTYAGARRNRLPDHITRVVSISGAAMARPGISRRAAMLLSLWKWPPKPFW